jgi:hypothetical protein
VKRVKVHNGRFKYLKITIKIHHEYGGRLMLELGKRRVLAQIELESGCGGNKRQ